MTTDAEFEQSQKGAWEHFIHGPGRATPGISRHLMSGEQLGFLLTEVKTLRKERDVLIAQLSEQLTGRKEPDSSNHFLDAYVQGKPNA